MDIKLTDIVSQYNLSTGSHGKIAAGIVQYQGFKNNPKYIKLLESERKAITIYNYVQELRFYANKTLKDRIEQVTDSKDKNKIREARDDLNQRANGLVIDYRNAMNDSKEYAKEIHYIFFSQPL